MYKAVCPNENCGAAYIGETARRLSERVKEHCSQDKNSALLKHKQEQGHLPMNMDNFQVLSEGHGYYRNRKIIEALYIKQQRPSLNEQGQSIPIGLLN